MKFVAEELPTFSIKTFNFENLLSFSNVRLWPIKNSSVALRLRNPAVEALNNEQLSSSIGW